MRGRIPMRGNGCPHAAHDRIGIAARHDRAIPLFAVIVITGHGDIAMAVTAVKAGAFDFIEKPIDEGRLAASIHDAIEANRGVLADERQLAELEKRFADLSNGSARSSSWPSRACPTRRSACSCASVRARSSTTASPPWNGCRRHDSLS